MNNLQPDDELVDTPLVSPFPNLDNNSKDGEVLNELIEYENVGMLRRERETNSFDRDDLAFQCMIGFRKLFTYFDPFLPMSIITRKAYNTIMVEGLESTGKNLVAIVRDVYVCVGRKAYLLEDKQIPSVGVFSTWMDFGGNTRDFGSFKEETNKITDLHQIYLILMHRVAGDGVAGIKRRRRDLYSNGARNLVTVSGRCLLKEDLESSTWRRR
nr:hypothetical protein [Tanacetum cinerariifolium]